MKKIALLLMSIEFFLLYLLVNYSNYYYSLAERTEELNTVIIGKILSDINFIIDFKILVAVSLYYLNYRFIRLFWNNLKYTKELKEEYEGKNK